MRIYRNLRLSLPFSQPILLTLACLAAGCGMSTGSGFAVNASATGCNAGNAAILVGDGVLQILCGCTGVGESNGTTFFGASPLTCHVSAVNSTVFFYYYGTRLRHQIVPSGTNFFVGSPMSDPNSSFQFRVHATSFSQAATTYDFRDASSQLNGQIIVP